MRYIWPLFIGVSFMCLVPPVQATTGFLDSDASIVYTWRIRDNQGQVIREMKSEFLSPSVEQFTWHRDYIYANGRLLASAGAGLGQGPDGLLAYHTDHLGTPRVIQSDSGDVVEHHYQPFGEEISAWFDRVPLKFTGHERDFDDLDYMRARYYRPSFGRFLSVDPAQDGWNRYAYANNNPINRLDSTGLGSEDGFFRKTANVFKNFIQFEGKNSFGGKFKLGGVLTVRGEFGKSNPYHFPDPSVRRLDDHYFSNFSLSLFSFGLGYDSDAGGFGFFVSKKAKAGKHGATRKLSSQIFAYSEKTPGAKVRLTLQDIVDISMGVQEMPDLAPAKPLNVGVSAGFLYGGDLSINGSDFLYNLDQEFPGILDTLYDHQLTQPLGDIFRALAGIE